MDDPFLFFFAPALLADWKLCTLSLRWCCCCWIQVRQFAYISENKRTAGEPMESGPKRLPRGCPCRSRRAPHGPSSEAAPHGAGAPMPPCALCVKMRCSHLVGSCLQVRQKEAKRLKLRPFGRGSPVRA